MTCQLGHATHDVVEVSTVQGRFKCFDVPKYASDVAGWCPGRYNVSDRLMVEGHWEPHDSVAIEAILRAGDRSRLVIDFGANIGWYTIMAAKLGYDVWAIEGDLETLDVLRQNTALYRVEHLVEATHRWVSGTSLFNTPREVELVKIDLEGMDRFAVEGCWRFIDRIANFYVEISPCWRDDYPALVDKLRGAGFSAFWPDNRPFDDDYSFGQFNLRFSR